MITPTNETEFKRKTAHEPTAATITPPRAGPTARAILKATLLSDTAADSSERGISSGTIACHAGAFKAEPRPSANISSSKTQGVVNPRKVSTARETAEANIQVCE